MKLIISYILVFLVIAIDAWLIIPDLQHVYSKNLCVKARKNLKIYSTSHSYDKLNSKNYGIAARIQRNLSTDSSLLPYTASTSQLDDNKSPDHNEYVDTKAHEPIESKSKSSTLSLINVSPHNEESKMSKQPIIFLPGLDGLGNYSEATFETLSEDFDCYRMVIDPTDR